MPPDSSALKACSSKDISSSDTTPWYARRYSSTRSRRIASSLLRDSSDFCFAKTTSRAHASADRVRSSDARVSSQSTSSMCAKPARIVSTRRPSSSDSSCSHFSR
eukprot:scaffold764_cov248-Pinguiococcus_pyrenoidosus.AAC.30